MFYKSLTLYVVVLSRKVVVLLRHLDGLAGQKKNPPHFIIVLSLKGPFSRNRAD